MTDRVTGPAPVRVGLGRSNRVVALLVLGFLIWATYAGVKGGWTSTGSARYLGFGFAALFGIPLVLMVRAMPRFLSPRYVIVDHAGLHIQHGREVVSVPWPEVAAVGIGYEFKPGDRAPTPVTPDQARDALKGYLAERSAEALQISDKRRLALEIFPVRLDAVDRVPRLRPYWKQLPPPAPGLAPQHWRFPLPPVTAIAEDISRAAYAFSPQRWLGWVAMPPT